MDVSPHLKIRTPLAEITLRAIAPGEEQPGSALRVRRSPVKAVRPSQRVLIRADPPSTLKSHYPQMNACAHPAVGRIGAL